MDKTSWQVIQNVFDSGLDGDVVSTHDTKEEAVAAMLAYVAKYPDAGWVQDGEMGWSCDAGWGDVRDGVYVDEVRS